MQNQLTESRSSQPASSERDVSVLVLDDNRVDIEAVSRCLRKIDAWNVSVTGCTSVQEAIESIEGKEFDLLFLDYQLHSQTGLDALESLRKAGLDVPTILMTDMRSEAVVVEALHAGIADYLPKSALDLDPIHRAARNAIEKAELSRAVKEKQAALAETIQRLEERQEEIVSFYHNVSHELKTPLTAAREFVALVIDGAVGPITEEQLDLLLAARRSCDQMVTCINDMLDASRIETGKLALACADIDLRDAVQDAARDIESRARAREVSIELELPEMPIPIHADRNRIYQVAVNLLGNAVKFSDPGGHVRVTASDRGPEGAVIEVVDHGCGIDPDVADRIFDRLFQSRAEDSATLGGLGMGLYICRELVELHGGTISVDGAVGRGCTFTVSLPLG